MFCFIRSYFAAFASRYLLITNGRYNQSEDDVVIFDINDVFEAILMFCRKRVWVALIDDHKSSELEDCIRPDLCVSKYLKIPFRKLREISDFFSPTAPEV